MEEEEQGVGTGGRGTHVWRALLCAFVLLLVMLCLSTPQLHETDDTTFPHALYLNDEASPHWLHPSYLLSHPLCQLSRWVPWVNVYLAYLYALLVCSAAAILHAAFRKGGGMTALGATGTAAACYIVIVLPQGMEYTPISFLAAGSGCMLVFHSLYGGGGRRGALLCGMALFFAGVVLRHDSAPGYLPFIGAASLFRVAKGSTLKEWYRRNRRWLPAPLVMAGLVMGVWMFQTVPAEGGWQGDGNLVGVHTVRMAYYDYPDYSGEDKAAVYEAEGVSQEELRLLENDIYRDNGVMTTAWWDKMSRLRRLDSPGHVPPLKAVRILLHTFKEWPWLSMGVFLLAAYGVWARRGKWRLYAPAIICAYLAGLYICCLKARCHSTPVMSLSYYTMVMLLLPCGMESPRRAFLRPWIIIPLCTVAALVCIHSRLQLSGGFRHVYERPDDRAALVEWAQQHPEQVFLIDSYGFRTVVYPYTALLNPKAPYIPNVVELGNWPTLLPYREQARQAHGLDNEATSITDPRVRLALPVPYPQWIDTLLHYLKARHGMEITLEVERRLTDTFAIYRAVLHGNGETEATSGHPGITYPR